MIYITRRECFSSAHRLFNPAYSDEENFETYGKCSNAGFHGHNYVMYVTVKGDVNPETGMVMNMKLLGDIVRQQVTDKLDHHNLNTDVDFLQGWITTSENIAIAAWEQLEGEIKKAGAELYKIKIAETENNYVEYYGI